MAEKLIKLYLLTMILFVFAGCIEHSPIDKNQDSNRIDYVHVNEDKFIVEYIQHAKKGNFSDSKLNDLISIWITNVNMMSNQPIFAEILMPSTPLGKVFGHHAPSRENFVWAIGFNSMISRNDFWSEWNIKYKLEWGNLIENTFDFDPNTTIFAPKLGREVVNYDNYKNKVFVFNTCAYSENKSTNDLSKFVLDFDTKVEQQQQPGRHSFLSYYVYKYAGEILQIVKDEAPKKAWNGYFWINVFDMSVDNPESMELNKKSQFSIGLDMFSSCTINVATSKRIWSRDI